MEMAQHPSGYVTLPAEYVYEMATRAINLIEKRRAKNLSDAILEIKFNVPFRKLKQRLGIYKCRSDDECVEILKERDFGFWWFCFVSHFEEDRLKQMRELRAAARFERPMLVTTNIAAYFKRQEELND